jgi:glucose-6-phosphate 1-dehydrogenase
MLSRLVLFGGTGDLTGRFLLPALASLQAAGQLPPDIDVLAVATKPWDSDQYRQHAAARLDLHAPDVPAVARSTLLRAVRYRSVDVTDTRSVAAAVEDSRRRGHASTADPSAPIAAYLALPTDVFPAAVTALGATGLTSECRLALEKPFGDDLMSAVTLNALLRSVLGPSGERMVFRVDHVLGMASTQNFLALRTADPILHAVWNSNFIERIDIQWEETLALEGRARYYDRAGALKDVMQNHMMQLLAMAAMEPPSDDTAEELQRRKLDALYSVRLPGEAAQHPRRARYTAGRLADTGGATGRLVPDYANEDGVDPSRDTETFAEVHLEVETPRWRGTRFVLRAGKALARRRKGITVTFRPSLRRPPAADLTAHGGKDSTPHEEQERGNQMWIGIVGPNHLSLQLTGADTSQRFTPLVLSGEPPAADLPAYAQVLRNILDGDARLSVGGEEAEQAWRILTPVMQSWADGTPPLLTYSAGSGGPRPLSVSAG